MALPHAHAEVGNNINDAAEINIIQAKKKGKSL